MPFLTKHSHSKQANKHTNKFSSVQFSSVAQSCPTLCDPMNRRSQASLSITNSWSLPKLISTESVMPSNHLIFCHPLLLLPSNKLELYCIFILCLLVMKSALQTLKVVSIGHKIGKNRKSLAEVRTVF